jgi:hypothetical protein
MKRAAVLSAIVAVIALAGLLVAGGAPATPTATVVMSGLDNPRGLAFGPGHTLYVAEAGKGGTGACIVLRGQNECVGATGAVSVLRKGVQERIVTGLPSYAPQPSGEGATGPHDVGLKGHKGYVTIGLGANPSARAVLGNGFGHLVRFKKKGDWKLSTDIAAYEASANPGGDVVESNPYGLLVEGGRLLVTDAGGNDLLRVGHHDSISTVAVFPSRAQGRATDSVPTAVTRGPDKAYYVSELTGVPFSVGAANVYRVVPGQAPQVYLSGFTALIDLQFARDGSLYVLEHATGAGLSGPGDIIRIAPNGSRTTVFTGLTSPTSLLLENKGKKVEAIYVSNRGTSASAGEVLRIRP